MRASISLARVWASSRLQPGSSPSVREGDEPAVRPQEPQRPRGRAGGVAHDPLHGRRVARDLLALGELRQRLEMGLDDVEVGHGPADRGLEVLGGVVGLGESHPARKLDVQRQLGAAVDLDQPDVVDLAHRRDRGRCRMDAFAKVIHVSRLDVDDDVGTRKGAFDRRLDGVGDRVPLADGRRRRGRR